MMKNSFTDNVFINCPFDNEYKPLFNALLYAIVMANCNPVSAKESSDSGVVRVTKIFNMIEKSKFGIHDISKEKRQNMPFELGVFLGAKHFSPPNEKPDKRDRPCLIIAEKQYTYQKFISDIAGQDIKCHSNDPKTLISEVYSWLREARAKKAIHDLEAKRSEVLTKYDVFSARITSTIQQHNNITYKSTITLARNIKKEFSL